MAPRTRALKTTPPNNKASNGPDLSGNTVLYGLILGLAAIYAHFCSQKYKVSFLWALSIIWPVVSVLFVIVYLSYVYPFYVSELRHIPTVPGYPLWGQFVDIITRECGLPQREWHKQHGPIIRYFFPFGSERLSIADDEMLRFITVKHPYNFPKPVRAKKWMERILGEGVLLAEGNDHVVQRKALTPAFSTQAINALQGVFWEKAMLLGDLWRGQMEEAGEKTMSIEVLEWLNRCTLDIIARAGFGIEIDCLNDGTALIREAYRLVFNFDLASRFFHGLQAFFPSSKHLPSNMNRDIKTARQIILDKATRIITDRLHDAKNDAGGRDILALIVKENKKMKDKGEESLSFETMRDQVMTFLGAGHDTTATGVVWTLHLLSIYPEVQAKLREEIRQHMPFLFDKDQRRDPTKLAGVNPDHLPYLDKVCRESLRFIPPIPLTVREVQVECMLGPYVIPKSTVIYMLANAINRLPSFWGETVDEFDPDRWGNLPDTAGPNAFMTFLQGPRGCIGRKFAETEMKIILCSLLSLYDFKRDYSTLDPEDWKMWRLVLRPKYGVTLKTALLE